VREASLLVPLGEGNGNRPANGIPVAIEIDDDAVETEPQALGHRLYDAPIGLMRDQPGEIMDSHFVALQDFRSHVRHAHNGGLEHGRPVLHDVMPSLDD
jgi:hypothetical protein